VVTLPCRTRSWSALIRTRSCDGMHHQTSRLPCELDMFVVATATFELLYAVIVLNQHRRRAIHFEVTQNPTHVWLARQITEAFPWDTAPCYLLRDRDTSYGVGFQNRVRAMEIEEVLTASRSPMDMPKGSSVLSAEIACTMSLSSAGGIFATCSAAIKILQ
jgi:hypothetical protein